jgi:hypothetical protein
MLLSYKVCPTAVNTNAILLPDFNQIWSLSTDFRKRPRPVGTALIYADRGTERRTDRHDEANRSFSLFIRTRLKRNIRLTHKSKQLWVYHWTVLRHRGSRLKWWLFWLVFWRWRVRILVGTPSWTSRGFPESLQANVGIAGLINLILRNDSLLPYPL